MVVVRVVSVVIVFVAAELFGISAAAAGSTYVAVAVASKIVKKGLGRGQASGQRLGSGWRAYWRQ